jgi:hypothetical protein
MISGKNKLAEFVIRKLEQLLRQLAHSILPKASDVGVVILSATLPLILTKEILLTILLI